MKLLLENWRKYLTEAKRIPRKKGQPAKSDKHSDLYTDEDPKGTIHGLGFKDETKARSSVAKIKKSNRSHAHKTQAAIAMEQRAKAAGKSKEAAIFRKFIEQQKKKTKAKNKNESMQLQERCQKGYKTHDTQKTKEMFGKTYRNCVKAEEAQEIEEKKKKAGTEARKESSLRDWFGRKGAPGKKGGWVDCNAPIRKDGKIVGHKPCGRQKGEKRKYPACRPTSAACKERGKGKTWGKKASKKKKKNEAIRRLHEALSLSDSARFSTPAKLSDNPYRPFSDKYYDYVKDQRSLWRGGKVSYDHLDEEILKSDLGEQVLHEGEMVPLDMPMPLMEAKLNGREVELNSPMRSSGPKKYKVYVKDPKTGNVKTVHFGDKKGGLAVKIHDAGARKSYVARHKCEQANDKMKPSYWACRIPRYSEQLGLSKMSYRFW